MMRISIIIPVLNEISELPRLLTQLTSQTLKPTEIIVGDCGSTDGTLDFLEKNARDVIVVHSNIKNPASARNAGARKANGDILIFIDADVSIQSGFIERLVAIHHTTKSDLTSPRIAYKNSSIVAKMHAYSVDRWIRKAIQKGHRVGASGVMCVSTKLFKKIGGFDTDLQKGEDEDFFRRSYSAGFRVHYARDLVYYPSDRRIRGVRGIFHTFVEDFVFVHIYKKNARSYDRYK